MMEAHVCALQEAHSEACPQHWPEADFDQQLCSDGSSSTTNDLDSFSSSIVDDNINHAAVLNNRWTPIADEELLLPVNDHRVNAGFTDSRHGVLDRTDLALGDDPSAWWPAGNDVFNHQLWTIDQSAPGFEFAPTFIEASLTGFHHDQSEGIDKMNSSTDSGTNHGMGSSTDDGFANPEPPLPEHTTMDNIVPTKDVKTSSSQPSEDTNPR